VIRNAAALYVDPRGPYPKLVADWYDAERDARTYAGPWPVVAHPPCGSRSKLRHLYKRDDGDCAPRALEQVRAFGGVLEHPRRRTPIRFAAWLLYLAGLANVERRAA
jgi:hypothetical protein